MIRETIIARLQGILDNLEGVDLTGVTEETPVEQLGLDSLTLLDFLYDVEQVLHVQLEAAELVDMERVGHLVDYLEARVAG